MSTTECVTVTLAAAPVERIDRRERNRSYFIAEALTRELTRRRREALPSSVHNPHPETADLADNSLQHWTADVPDSEGLGHVAGGNPVRWVEGQAGSRSRRDGNCDMSLTTRRFAALALTASVVACDGTPTEPSSEAVITFRVVDETFRVLLTSPDQLAAARAAQAGGRARIPVGRIVSGRQVNVGWTWHLEDVVFAEQTIEVCDGLPSHVEREGTHFGAGSYCPWSAVIVRIDER